MISLPLITAIRSIRSSIRPLTRLENRRSNGISFSGGESRVDKMVGMYEYFPDYPESNNMRIVHDAPQESRSPHRSHRCVSYRPNTADPSSLLVLTFSNRQLTTRQTSAESDPMVTAQTKALWFRRLYPTNHFLPSLRSCPTPTGNLMPTSYQGASGPSGPRAGSLPAPRQPVSGDHAVSEPILKRRNSNREKICCSIKCGN